LELVTNINGKGRFELGYTIVCNRSQSDLSITFDERNVKEVAFFTLDPWSSLPKERAGIKALKHRLNNLLVDVTRRNFQGVAMDIRRRMEKLKQQLDIMGPVRQTAHEQRNHLITIASKFREITTKAIDAYYSRDQCFEMDDIFRLATLVMQMNRDFSETVHNKGFTRAFDGVQPAVDVLSGHKPSPNDDRTPDHDTDSHSSGETPTPETELPRYPELRRIMAQIETVPEAAEDDIVKWIAYKYNRSKGFEIGTINPSLMPSLFAEQSRAWGFYAHSHVTKVILKIHHFNHEALQYCCNNDTLCERLWNKLVQPLLPSYEKALQQVSFLVEIERHGNLMTMNHYFAENVRKAREARLKLQFEALNSWDTGGEHREPLLRLKDILGVVMSNDDHTIQDLHDTLQSYYKVARKRFVDAVCLQAVDHFLVSGKTSPLWIFSPHFVGNMSDAELHQIAGDEDETLKRRNMLETELASLKKGEKIMEI
jgi:Dynamin central region